MVLVEQDPNSYVKFSLVDKKWPLNVFLNDEGVMFNFVMRR